MISKTHDWAARGACRTSDPDALFVQGAAQNRAKAVCLGCPVRTECLADALDNRTEFGVWGGMTERERRALPRRRPNGRSWKGLLATARAELFDAIGVFRPVSNAVMLYGQADDLHWFARQLAQASFDFEVLEPPALRDAIRDSARRLLRLAEGPTQAEQCVVTIS